MRQLLIVDDNPALRDTLAEALAAEGFAVDSAAGHEEALEILRRRPPHLMLLDLLGTDAPQLLRTLEREGPRVPVVAVSGDPRLAHESHELGVAAHLVKPFDLDALLDLIDRLAPPAQPAEPPAALRPDEEA